MPVSFPAAHFCRKRTGPASAFSRGFCTSPWRGLVRFQALRDGPPREAAVWERVRMADQAQPFPAMSIAQANAILTAPGARFEMEEKVIGGVKLRVYKNAPLTLRDIVLNSINWDQREFLVYLDERVTFAAHYKAVAHLATRLRNDFG